MTEEICVCITGAAGQVAGNLIPYISDGNVYGDKKVVLKLLDITEKVDMLQAIKLELEDGCYSAISEVIVTDKPEIAFKDVNRAILIGGKPRGKGMTRSDLIIDNAKIFASHGKLLNKLASNDIHVLVVANPSNTNCYIAMKNAPDIAKERFSALSFLDLNRAYSIISKKTNVTTDKIKNVTIWGNHGETVFADIDHAYIDGKIAVEVIDDKEWVHRELLEKIRKRGSEIISYKGKSSGFSASKAIVDHLRRIEYKYDDNNWFCAAVPSDGSYGIREGLIFSFPVIGYGQGDYKIVSDLRISDTTKILMSNSVNELENELELVYKELDLECIYD